MNTFNSLTDLGFNFGEDVDRIINGFKEDLERREYFKNMVMNELVEVVEKRNVEYKYEYCMDELEVIIIDNSNDIIYDFCSCYNILRVNRYVKWYGLELKIRGVIKDSRGGMIIGGFKNKRSDIEILGRTSKMKREMEYNGLLGIANWLRGNRNYRY